jgi:hypothetical protein
VAGRASVPIDDPVPALPSLIRELVDRMPDLDAQRVEIELNSAPRLSSFKLLDPSRAQPWRRRLFRWRSPATHRRRRRRPRVVVGRQAFTPSRPARSRRLAVRLVAWCVSSIPLRLPRGRAVLRGGGRAELDRTALSPRQLSTHPSINSPVCSFRTPSGVQRRSTSTPSGQDDPGLTPTIATHNLRRA